MAEGKVHSGRRRTAAVAAVASLTVSGLILIRTGWFSA